MCPSPVFFKQLIMEDVNLGNILLAYIEFITGVINKKAAQGGKFRFALLCCFI